MSNSITIEPPGHILSHVLAFTHLLREMGVDVSPGQALELVRALEYAPITSREDFLDTCQGRCLLKQPELAQIVLDAMLNFDGQRYRLGDLVVMPNHVHVLIQVYEKQSLGKIVQSWKSFTARSAAG